MQPDQPTFRVLVVADRTADPFPLVERLRERARNERVAATVVVPASLHGIEWVGDPLAEVPDASRHAALVQVALLNAGVARAVARVGDADAHAAVDDALARGDFDEIVLNVRSSRLAAALGLTLAARIAPDSDVGVTDLRPKRRWRPLPIASSAAAAAA
jgi:hypothetical protein